MLTSIIDHRFGAHHCGFDVRTETAALANSQNMCFSCTWCFHDNPSAARDTAVWLEIYAGTFWTEMVPIRARHICWWRGHIISVIRIDLTRFCSIVVQNFRTWYVRHLGELAPNIPCCCPVRNVHTCNRSNGGIHGTSYIRSLCHPGGTLNKVKFMQQATM